MARLRRGAIILTTSIALLGGTSTVAFGDIDVSGTVATDQTPAAGSEVVAPLIAPSAVSVNGQAAGTPTTSTLAPDETDAPYNLQVYTSTASGTAALTGAVVDSTTGSVVAGAQVTLQPSAGGASTTVAADSNGGFAFVNIPVGTSGTPYTLSISAAGYGTYTVTNDRYSPGTTYDTTAELGTSTQSYDASQTVSQGTQAASAAGTLAPFTSYRRTPPTIRVAMFQQNSSCAPGSSGFSVRTWPWRFYALHVTVGEIPASWPETTVRANMLAITNYAWYFMRHPAGSDYNVDNTTDFQCFKPYRSVPTKFHGWLDGVLLSHFRNNSDSDIHITQYRAGSYSCQQLNDLLWQNGSLALVQQCGYSFYKNIDNFYYAGSFADSVTPPVPNTSFSRPSGGVKLVFPSQVSDSSGHTSNVGWRYTVEKRVQVPSGFIWVVIYDQGFVSSSRGVPTSFTYKTGTCYMYRVKASNAVGSSSYASFNSGNNICPG